MTFLKAIGAAGAMAFFVGSASASTTIQTFEFGPSTTASGTASFDRFNDPLSILKNVTLNLSASFSSTIFIESTVSGQSATTPRAGIEDTFFEFTSDVFDSFRIDVADVEYDQVTSTGPDDRATSTLAREGSQTLSFSGDDLAAFLGIGQFEVGIGTFNDQFAQFGWPGLDGIGFFAEATSGNVNFGSATDFSGSATLTYEYTAIPLPATGWLMLAAFGGLGVVARRKARKKA